MFLKKERRTFLWSARRSWRILPLWGDVQHVKKKGMSSHFTYQYQHPTVARSEILHAPPVMYENPYIQRKNSHNSPNTSTAWSRRDFWLPSNTTILSGFLLPISAIEKNSGGLRSPENTAIRARHPGAPFGSTNRDGSWEPGWRIEPEALRLGVWCFSNSTCFRGFQEPQFFCTYKFT